MGTSKLYSALAGLVRPSHLNPCPINAHTPIPFEYSPTPTGGNENLALGAWKAVASHRVAKSASSVTLIGIYGGCGSGKSPYGALR